MKFVQIMMSEENKEDKSKWYQNPWLKRIGITGFLFFFIKGLIWLAIFFGFFKWLNGS